MTESPSASAEEERPAYTLGRTAHTLILESLDRFEEDFAVGVPINPKTGQPFGASTKAWAEWAEAIGKPVLTETQFDVIARMNESVRTHPVAMAFLAADEPEGVVRANYCSVPSQIRVDWFDVNSASRTSRPATT